MIKQLHLALFYLLSTASSTTYVPSLIDLQLDYHIMDDLSFRDSLALAYAVLPLGSKIINPLDLDSRNPLEFHNPNLDDHFALKHIFESNQEKWKFYFEKLVKNERINLTAHEHSAFYTAAEKGRLDILQILFRNSNIDSKVMTKIFEIACQKGGFDIVDYFINNQIKLDQNYSHFVKIAAASGHESIVFRFLPFVPTELLSYLLYLACSHGHINIVSQLLDLKLDNNRPVLDLKQGYYETRSALMAIKDKHLQVLQTIVKYDYIVTYNDLLEAARCRHEDIVKYLLSLNYVWADIVFVIHNLKKLKVSMDDNMISLLESHKLQAKDKYYEGLKSAKVINH